MLQAAGDELELAVLRHCLTERHPGRYGEAHCTAPHGNAPVARRNATARATPWSTGRPGNRPTGAGLDASDTVEEPEPDRRRNRNRPASTSRAAAATPRNAASRRSPPVSTPARAAAPSAAAHSASENQSVTRRRSDAICRDPGTHDVRHPAPQTSGNTHTGRSLCGPAGAPPLKGVPGGRTIGRRRGVTHPPATAPRLPAPHLTPHHHAI